jgi:hypothetical protein
MQFVCIPWARDFTLFHQQDTLPYCYIRNILFLHVPWSRHFTLLWSIILFTFTFKIQFAYMPWARDFTLSYVQDNLPYCYTIHILCLHVPWSKDFPWERDFTLFHKQETRHYCYLSNILCFHILWSKDFTRMWWNVSFQKTIQLTCIPWAIKRLYHLQSVRDCLTVILAI